MKAFGLRILLLMLTVGALGACGDPDTAPPPSISESSLGNGGDAGVNADSRPAVSGTDIDDAIAKEWGANGANGGAGDRVFFETDKSILKPEGRTQLTRWVAFLQKYPHEQLVVEGHSDERGTREYNLSLGERRANTVKEFLVANGIDSSRIETVTYGKERPDAIGSNEQAWALNRRAVGILQ
jgi:peptidoglycan-associated lipoprotein